MFSRRLRQYCVVAGVLMPSYALAAVSDGSHVSAVDRLASILASFIIATFFGGGILELLTALLYKHGRITGTALITCHYYIMLAQALVSAFLFLSAIIEFQTLPAVLTGFWLLLTVFAAIRLRSLRRAAVANEGRTISVTTDQMHRVRVVVGYFMLFLFLIMPVIICYILLTIVDWRLSFIVTAIVSTVALWVFGISYYRRWYQEQN